MFYRNVIIKKVKKLNMKRRDLRKERMREYG